MFPDRLLISSKRPSFNNGPFSPTARVAGTYWIVCFNSSILCMRVLLPLLFAPAITVMGARSTAILSLNDLKFLIDHFFSMLRAQSCSVGTYTLESSRLVARLKRNFFGPQAPASARNGNNVMPWRVFAGSDAPGPAPGGAERAFRGACPERELACVSRLARGFAGRRIGQRRSGCRGSRRNAPSEN